MTGVQTCALPIYLIADSALEAGAPLRAGDPRFSVRRTRSGDAWEAGVQGLDAGGSCGTGHGGAAPAGPVTLGMPSLRRG